MLNRQLAREKAIRLVAKMTLSEAASQLRYDSPEIERLGIPAYNWWNEGLHGLARAGVATSFPQAVGLAATFDTELVREVGEIVSTEARAKYNASSSHNDRDIYKGLTIWSPNINIFRDPRWGRGQETYGEDPVLTAELGCAYVRGVQGDGETLRASACAKHFSVHSGPEALRHRFNAEVSPRDMAETYLPAFEALVRKAGVEAVMGAYNRTNGEPCCGSGTLIGLLREKWGFEGHFVSDCWAIRDFHENHQVTTDAAESAALAINNGCDLNCGCTYIELMKAHARGLVSEETIRNAAVRLFTTRFLLGLFEPGEYDAIPFTKVECREHIAKAHEASQKACVLLKNNGILPLRKEKLRTVGVVGPNANSRTALIGNYHGTSSRYITVLEGIQDELGEDVHVLYSEGCHLRFNRVEPLAQPDDRISEAITVAENSDTVICVVGLDQTLEGEEGDSGNPEASGDKTSLNLPQSQQRMLSAVLAVGKPTVIVLMAGSSIDLGEAEEKADAVLLGWYPGARGGKAIAEILFGRVSPSGKLPVTFYRQSQLKELPAFTDYTMKGRTYRYLESKPLYPFGYGLTYGDVFAESLTAVSAEDGVQVTVRVCNHGSRATEDILQIYARNEGSAYTTPHPRLVGFLRISLCARETGEYRLTIPSERLSVINEEGESVRDGIVRLFAGMGQPDEQTAALTGHAALSVSLSRTL